MILVFIDLNFNNTNERARVSGIHYEPQSLTDEQKSEGIEVNSIPTPLDNGKIPTLYINKITKELWYEYTERPLTLEDKVATLEAENANINYILMMGGLI